MKVSLTSVAYVDKTVATLQAAQAAGTSPVLAANRYRKALMINPPADCVLGITPGGSGGWPLYGGVANTIAGMECPNTDLYIYGLATSQPLTMWEG